MSQITGEKIRLYRSIFNTRDDVLARYWEDFESKKSGYVPIYRLSQSPQALTDTVISNHLMGNQTIGIYPLFPDNTTAFLAIDFDGSEWFEPARRVSEVAQTYQLNSYLERSKSGNGGHLWFFFTERISAYTARQMGKLFLSKAGIKNGATFDRMFPSQDEHTGKGYGNLICLPLQGKLVAEHKTVFIDSNGQAFPNQWAFLSTIQKISPAQIKNLLESSLVFQQTPSESKKTTSEDQLQSTEEDFDIEIVVTTTQGQEVKLILGAGISIPNIWLPDKLYRFFKKELNFPNPEFYAKERFGYSTWQTSRFIKTIDVNPEGITIPAGYLDQVLQFINENQFRVEIVDNRTTTKTTTFKSKLKLRKNQQKELTQLLKYERIIFQAQPGFGKTVVALSLMKKRRQKTLIIVHTNALLRQWIKRINDHFEMDKGDLGTIGNNKWQIGKEITIASYLTLARRDIGEIKDEFGLIIIDECHHVPANTFSAVVRQFSAKYVLGLTATAYRKDKLEKLMHLYISDKSVTVDTSAEASKDHPNNHVQTQLVTKKTNFSVNGKVADFQEACRLVVADEGRNNQITDDVVQVLSTGAKCLVLTERLEHCETLLTLVRQKIKGIHAAVATGRMTKKQRENMTKRLHQERFQLLIATGKLIGEGFDWPEVSHLFLAFPFSWKGKLIQYVGRIQRASEGKTIAVAHDYFDDQVPMLKLMYFKRLRTYRSLRLIKISSPSKKKENNEKQLSLF